MEVMPVNSAERMYAIVVIFSGLVSWRFSTQLSGTYGKKRQKMMEKIRKS